MALPLRPSLSTTEAFQSASYSAGENVLCSSFLKGIEQVTNDPTKEALSEEHFDWPFDEGDRAYLAPVLGCTIRDSFSELCVDWLITRETRHYLIQLDTQLLHLTSSFRHEDRTTQSRWDQDRRRIEANNRTKDAALDENWEKALKSADVEDRLREIWPGEAITARRARAFCLKYLSEDAIINAFEKKTTRGIMADQRFFNAKTGRHFLSAIRALDDA